MLNTYLLAKMHIMQITVLIIYLIQIITDPVLEIRNRSTSFICTNEYVSKWLCV